MSTWDNKLIKGSQVESDLLALAQPIFRGINSRPSSSTYGYTHVGTISVTDSNKRGNIALDVYAGQRCARLHCITATLGYENDTTINAVYSAYSPTAGERGRFKLCYKFADGHTADSPKIEVWLIDVTNPASSTRRCACVVHSVAGVTWTDGNQTSTTTLPANLVDFDAAQPYGVLPVECGGTGADAAVGAEYNLTPNLGNELTTVPQGTYKIPFLTSNPSATNGRFTGYRELSTVWQYFKTQADPLYADKNADGYNKGTGSAVRGLLDLGKFSYSSNHELSATFRISYTDRRQYAPVEILLRLQIKYNGNATDGILSITSDSKFYAYKIRSGQNGNTTDYECYLRIINGELHVLVGMTSTTTAQANIVVRCLWNVQSFRSPFTVLNEAIEELPDYTSMIVVPKYHMAYADAAGANGAPVTVDKYGKLLPLDSIQATSVGYLRLDGTVSDFDTYSIMVMDADGVVYKDASAYNKLAYRAQDNCIGSNIDGWATMLEPKALSSIPSEAPDILHVPLLDSSRYVRTDQSSTPTRMVYSRSTNTLSVNVNGKVNGKTFVFGAYAGELNTVYFC